MNKKPHIAMILPDRIENPVGGMGVQAKYLIKHLEKDFDFSVHGFPDETNLPYYYNVYNYLPNILHGGLNTLTGQAYYLESIMKMTLQENKKPDLIHTLDYTEFIAGVAASNTLKVPLVVSMQLSAHLMHEMDLYNAREPNSPDGIAIENSMKEMELLGLQKADHIIHVSNVYKKIFSKIPGLDKKSTFIPNGVELDEFKTVGESKHKILLPGQERLKVIYLGRFAPQKNIFSLLNAKIPREIDLVFVGDRNSGPKEIINLLENKCQSEQNVHYYGPAYGSEKISLLQSADAVIIPSKHECHPLVMHEAMAAGCVVLHSGAGDMSEVLTDDFTINCGITPEKITESLINLTRLPKEKLNLYKNKSLDKVKKYTWNNAAQKTKYVYDKLIIKSE